MSTFKPRFKLFPRWAEISYHTVYLPPLNPSSVVLDLGASTANFSNKLNDLSGGYYHAIEALPENYSLIQETPFLTRHLHAIGEIDGPVSIHSVVGEFASAAVHLMADQRSRGIVWVEGLTLASLISRLGLDRVNLLKVDIEGAELSMFDAADDATLQRIDQMTVEFHDFMDPNLTTSVERVIARLRSLGFWSIKFSHRFYSDVVFLNSERIRISQAELYYAKHVIRPIRGVGRRVRRLLTNSLKFLD